MSIVVSFQVLNFTLNCCKGPKKVVGESSHIIVLVLQVADELVHEFSDPLRSAMSPGDQLAYDQKNIRRRVYDALNVLMAMNIISKVRV